MIQLSILIPSTPEREGQLNELLFKIYQQGLFQDQWETLSDQRFQRATSVKGGFEIIVCIDNKEISIGEKRQLLYSVATGLYCTMYDSDDSISDDALELVMQGVRSNCDCITYEESINLNGIFYRGNHSLIYNDWEGNGKVLFDDGFHFHRTPFFKSVIKTEIAKAVEIPHIRYGEDHIFAKNLKPYLKNEFHISSQIYKYQYITSNFNERYGIK